jgi:hypothetical protein
VLGSVDDGARCSLASQQRTAVGSLLDAYPDTVRAHLSGAAPAREPEPIAELVDIVDGRATIDSSQISKQPDWTFSAQWSGKTPAARLGEHRTGGGSDL